MQIIWGIIGLSLVFTYALCKAAARGGKQIEEVAAEDKDLLLSDTRTAGSTSCINKCRELGIDPNGHDFGCVYVVKVKPVKESK